MAEQNDVKPSAEKADREGKTGLHTTPAGGEQPESPKVRAAADAVCRASEELEKAQQLYEQVRQEATERLRRVRQTTVGDVMDNTLDVVKKHPGAGLTVAALLGFFLGRLFRR